MKAIPKPEYNKKTVITTTILLDVVDILNVVGTFETKAAASVLMNIIDARQTMVEEIPEVKRMSVYVGDQELMVMYDDIADAFGFDRWFLSRDAVHHACGPQYIYRSRGLESLRSGLLLAALTANGFVTSKSAGKGLMKWKALKKA
jgi:hypothetical protein